MTILYAGIVTCTYVVQTFLFDLVSGRHAHSLWHHAFHELDELVFIVLVSCFVGWFMARKALHGVGELSRTAKAISKGAFNSRVSLKGNRNELHELAATFNTMVDRVQALIKGMKEVTDSVAHDLRTPVTRMRGLAEVTLTARRSSDEYEAMAGSIIEECDRLLGMINATLEVSSAESGIVPLLVEKVDIAEVARDACELLQPAAEDKGVTIALAASGPARVDGDLRRLQRVLANLLDNAVKYTEKGGQVEVSVTNDDSHVIVLVRDTGIGIAEDDLPYIFDRFYRAEKSRSKPGSGLGLTLARAFVSAHKGSMTVTSRPGEGSTFEVILPAAKDTGK